MDRYRIGFAMFLICMKIHAQEPHATQLQEVEVTGKRLIEKKFGIRHRGAIRFTDGMFRTGERFEIGQVISTGNDPVHITSVNLYVNSTLPDSARFRISFYRYDHDNQTPLGRLYEPILQQHPVKQGWLKFDLAEHDVILRGHSLAAIEVMPETGSDQKVVYEVKLGGTSRSYFRRSGEDDWTRPPHHYCLYVTAVGTATMPDDLDEAESAPAAILKSDFSPEPFYLFVSLPENYGKKRTRHPVIYVLDGNAYFDSIVDFAGRYFKRKRRPIEPIVVGIGYGNAYVMDSLRTRDYTYPSALPADSFALSGNGDQFYRFMKHRLVTFIDSAYRTDATNRMLMGHSLGGYFVLFALTNQLGRERVFSDFVAASPSLYYHDRFLIRQFNDVSIRSGDIRLLVTVGERELLEDVSNDFQALVDLITERGLLPIDYKILKGAEHMGTAVPSFEDGVKLMATEQ